MVAEIARREEKIPKPGACCHFCHFPSMPRALSRGEKGRGGFTLMHGSIVKTVVVTCGGYNTRERLVSARCVPRGTQAGEDPTTL
jgi:hypothetical protein